MSPFTFLRISGIKTKYTTQCAGASAEGIVETKVDRYRHFTPRRLHPVDVPGLFLAARHSPPPLPLPSLAPLDIAPFSFPPRFSAIASGTFPHFYLSLTLFPSISLYPSLSVPVSLARSVVPVPAGIDSRWRAVTAPIVAVCR